MGWLLKRSVQIDGLRVDLDACDSTLVESGAAPDQPSVFVVKTSLPAGLNDRGGYILCKIDRELIHSGGPFRDAVHPVAFAFEGDEHWTPCECWKNRWELAAITIPIGNDQNGSRAITFVPAVNSGDRRAFYSYWCPTNYDGVGYWTDSTPSFECQWSDVVDIVHSEVLRHPLECAENVVLLPTGDAEFLRAQSVEI